MIYTCPKCGSRVEWYPIGIEAPAMSCDFCGVNMEPDGEVAAGKIYLSLLDKSREAGYIKI